MMCLIDQYENLVFDIRQCNSANNLISLNKEVIFNFSYQSLKQFYEDYLDRAQYLAFRERIYSHPMPEITKEERRKIYDIENYEREMILNDLKFSTHIVISKYNEPIESRRFIAINDSCMSFSQVTVSPDFYRWNFVSRSTEVNKMLPADLLTIGRIIEKWISWFIVYRPDHFNPNRGVSITIMLNNPHYYK